MSDTTNFEPATPDLVLHGAAVTPDGLIEDAIVAVSEGTIDFVRPRSQVDAEVARRAREVDYILPGFVDMHNHGGAGEGFPTSDRAGCERAALHHIQRGSTSVLASLVTGPGDHLVRQTALLADVAEDGFVAGIHAEGPFVNPKRCGAQDPSAIIGGDPALLEKLAEAGRGYLKSVTFAPETQNALALLDVCAAHGIIASFGHTDADYRTTRALVDAATDRGVKVTATHLFNAMPPIHHRGPGAAAALMDVAAVGQATVEIIADGVHLDDCTVDWVVDCVGVDNIVLITDAMAAAGMCDGHYVLGDLDVTVRDSTARLSTDDGSEGSIAGGTTDLMVQVQRHIRRGHDLVDLVRMATNGAGLLGRPEVASLAKGSVANLIVADAQLGVAAVFRRGVAV